MLSGARHYGWTVAAWLPRSAMVAQPFRETVAADLYLLPTAEPGTATAADVVTGLGSGWWQRHDATTPARFCAVVPDELSPELAMQRLDAIKGRPTAQVRS